MKGAGGQLPLLFTEAKSAGTSTTFVGSVSLFVARLSVSVCNTKIKKSSIHFQFLNLNV